LFSIVILLFLKDILFDEFSVSFVARHIINDDSNNPVMCAEMQYGQN